MFSNSKYIDILFRNNNMQDMLSDAENISSSLFKNELKDLDINNYIYTPDEAIRELDLELEIVDQLIEDYVAQIIKSNVQFLSYINKLQTDKNNNKKLDYTNLRNLAHKNLGVAKNLRIKDAQKLLYKMLKDDDLDYILKCLEALIASAIILKPKCSYDTILLMNLKKNL